MKSKVNVTFERRNPKGFGYYLSFEYGSDPRIAFEKSCEFMRFIPNSGFYLNGCEFQMINCANQQTITFECEEPVIISFKPSEMNTSFSIFMSHYTAQILKLSEESKQYHMELKQRNKERESLLEELCVPETFTNVYTAVCYLIRLYPYLKRMDYYYPVDALVKQLGFNGYLYQCQDKTPCDDSKTMGERLVSKVIRSLLNDEQIPYDQYQKLKHWVQTYQTEFDQPIGLIYQKSLGTNSKRLLGI